MTSICFRPSCGNYTSSPLASWCSVHEKEPHCGMQGCPVFDEKQLVKCPMTPDGFVMERRCLRHLITPPPVKLSQDEMKKFQAYAEWAQLQFGRIAESFGSSAKSMSAVEFGICYDLKQHIRGNCALCRSPTRFYSGLAHCNVCQLALLPPMPSPTSPYNWRICIKYQAVAKIDYMVQTQAELAAATLLGACEIHHYQQVQSRYFTPT